MGFSLVDCFTEIDFLSQDRVYLHFGKNVVNDSVLNNCIEFIKYTGKSSSAVPVNNVNDNIAHVTRRTDHRIVHQTGPEKRALQRKEVQPTNCQIAIE